MKKIKILYYGYTGNIGGIEKYLINVYRNIDKINFDIKFLIFKNEKPCFFNEIKDDIIYITSRRENYFKFCKELKQIFINNNFDIIHLNYVDFSCFEPALYAKKYSNAKVILHSHIAFFKMPTLKTKILNEIGLHKLIKNDNLFYKVGCSELANEYMFRKFKKNNATVLNNGVDVNQFAFNLESRKRVRNELGIDEKCILLGNVGRMVYQKNQEYLIDILSNLSRNSNNYKLLIIGKGPLKSKIIQKAKKLDILDKLIILSDINNVYDYMSGMDIFVFPSNFEGLGIVLIEAQASGLKCITSDKVVPYEVNVTGEVCFEKLKSFNKWIEYILSNSDQKRYNKLDMISENYDIKNSVKNLEIYYMNILEANNNEQ